MCLVVVDSVERGPKLDDYEDSLENNVFVKVLDVDHHLGIRQISNKKDIIMHAVLRGWGMDKTVDRLKRYNKNIRVRTDVL